MAELESKTIHSVAKAIHLLDLLTAGGQPASLTELYQKTGWPKSTNPRGCCPRCVRPDSLNRTPTGAIGWVSGCLNMAAPCPTHGTSARSRGPICRS